MRSLTGWALTPTGIGVTGAHRNRSTARRRGVAGAAITAIVAATLASGAVAPAYAALTGPVGPVDAVTGFPMSYSDGTVALALCDQGEAAGCLSPLPDPTAAVSFPGNYPDEAFWFHAAAGTDLQPALYEAALEGAFMSADGSVEDGQQQAFSRLRFRLDGMTPAASYTIVHPYGVDIFEADEFGVIDATDDQGCVVAPCDFGLARAAFVGNASPTSGFLTQSNQDTGMIGSLTTPGTVTGAPSGNNFVQVTGPNAGGPGIETFTVNQFKVQGKIAGAAVAPAAPAAPAATRGASSAVVRWSAPGNGGSAILDYAVEAINAADTVVQAATKVVPAAARTSANSTTVSGLTNGQAYRFQVTARNALGTGAVSARSIAVTPATVASAPRIGASYAGSAAVQARWTPPTVNGGLAVSGYEVRTFNAAGATVKVGFAGATATTLWVTGLTNGQAYRFMVRAKNGVGSGAFSAPSIAVTPTGVASAPRIGTASSGAAGGPVNAVARWAAPASTGGTAITSYVVAALRIAPAGNVASTTWHAATASARSLTVTRPAGVYRFQVQARNAKGISAKSTMSGVVSAR